MNKTNNMEFSMNHTKGKWEVTNQNGTIYITPEDGEALAIVRQNLDGKNNPERIKEAEANATLIASAPEMLDMLIDLYNRLPLKTKAFDNSELKDEAWKIIAKAKWGK